MDEEILLWVNSHYTDFLDAFMPVMTHRFAWIPMYLALAYAIIRTLGWKKGGLFIAAVALTTVLSDQIGASVIRPWVARMRPSNPENPLSEMVRIVGGYRGGAYGMPSCHAANTVGLLTIFLLRFRSRVFGGVLALWVLMQMYSRMYLGVHYPTDLLVGGVLGVACAFCSFIIYMYANKRFFNDCSNRQKIACEAVPSATFAATLTVMFIAAFLMS